MVDFARLDYVLDHMRAHPDQVDMWIWYRAPMTPAHRLQDRRLAEDWQCGTVACLAGWTAILAGWQPDPVGEEGRLVHPETGLHQTARDVARAHLGLNDDQAEALFTEATTEGHVRIMVDALRRDPHAEGRYLVSLVRYYESLES